jgi:hypothetical protein
MKKNLKNLKLKMIFYIENIYYLLDYIWDQINFINFRLRKPGDRRSRRLDELVNTY